jgi:hypothetical protein
MLDPALPSEVENRLLRRDSRTGVSSMTTAARRMDSSSHPASSAAERKVGLSTPAPPSLVAAAAAFDRRGTDLGLSAVSLDAIAVPVLRGEPLGRNNGREFSKWDSWPLVLRSLTYSDWLAGGTTIYNANIYSMNFFTGTLKCTVLFFCYS